MKGHKDQWRKAASGIRCCTTTTHGWTVQWINGKVVFKHNDFPAWFLFDICLTEELSFTKKIPVLFNVKVFTQAITAILELLLNLKPG